MKNLAYGELEFPVLVPVPLHSSRQRQRGFNQSLAIARGLRRTLRRVLGNRSLPIDSGLLRRIRPTAPQTGLSLRKREENVKGVFSVPDRKRTKGKDIVLIDDVMTTGATLASCAAALKSAGARTILAIVVSRSTPDFPDLQDPSALPDIDGEAREWT